MKFQISHTTTYRYARPVILLPHRMMLRPRSTLELAVVASSLVCSPASETSWAQDVFGNLIAVSSFRVPTSELTIESTATVEQSATAWPVFQIAPEAHSFPFTYSHDELMNLGALRLPEHVDAAGRLEAWARGFSPTGAADTLSLLQSINSGIPDQVSYRVRDEEGTQSPLETLDLASGSCRDIAALFIEAARHLGFGARAISGYLFDEGAVERTDPRYLTLPPCSALGGTGLHLKETEMKRACLRRNRSLACEGASGGNPDGGIVPQA